MKKIPFLLVAFFALVVTVLSSCTKETDDISTITPAVTTSILPSPPEDEIGDNAERLRLCPQAEGVTVSTFTQAMVNFTSTSITVGGTVVNPPLNAVVNIEYYVLDCGRWTNRNLVFAWANTTGLPNFTFAVALPVSHTGTTILYRPLVYVGCERPIQGHWEIVHN